MNRALLQVGCVGIIIHFSNLFCFSVVSKEIGADGKEDLKLDTVAVTIEGQEDEDPALKIPGKLSQY